MDAIRQLASLVNMSFLGSSTVINVYVLAQTVRLILEAQEEAVAYHSRALATYSAMPPDKLPYHGSPAAPGMTIVQFPEDPFPRPFWAVFFLLSPTAALLWFNVVDLTLEGLLGCMLWPRLKVLQAVVAKGYHLSPHGRDVLVPLFLGIFIYWCNMMHLARIYRNAVYGARQQQLRYRTIRRGEVHPLRADLKNFNGFQLRSLECELLYLLTELTHPRAKEILSRRLHEVAEALQWRSWNGPPSRINECVICWGAEPVREFVPCGHSVLCEGCAPTWREHERRRAPYGQPVCPQCRVTVLREVFTRTYPAKLLRQEEYRRQRDETTRRELHGLYDAVRTRPELRQRLRRCPSDAFDSWRAFEEASLSNASGNRRHAAPFQTRTGWGCGADT